MRKFIGLVLFLVFVVGLTGCAERRAERQQNRQNANTETQVEGETEADARLEEIDAMFNGMSAEEITVEGIE